MFEEYYSDNRTAYIVTSDHGMTDWGWLLYGGYLWGCKTGVRCNGRVWCYGGCKIGVRCNAGWVLVHVLVWCYGGCNIGVSCNGRVWCYGGCKIGSIVMDIWYLPLTIPTLTTTVPNYPYPYPNYPTPNYHYPKYPYP